MTTRDDLAEAKAIKSLLLELGFLTTRRSAVVLRHFRLARAAQCREDAALQPATAEDPNEDAYQRGRFVGIMEFAQAIYARAAELEKPEGER